MSSKNKTMISNTKLRIANASLILLALFYLIMLGGGNYEHINISGVISSAPPKSFYILQGPFGFNPVKFWATFRPITILLFIIAIIFNWKHSAFRRNGLVIAFVIDILITVATFSYFAPEIGAITSIPYVDSVDPSLAERTSRWTSLNLIRLGAFYIVSVMILVVTNRPAASARM
jgi:hypothetical protein